MTTTTWLRILSRNKNHYYHHLFTTTTTTTTTATHHQQQAVVVGLVRKRSLHHSHRYYHHHDGGIRTRFHTNTNNTNGMITSTTAAASAAALVCVILTATTQQQQQQQQKEETFHHNNTNNKMIKSTTTTTSSSSTAESTVTSSTSESPTNTNLYNTNVLWRMQKQLQQHQQPSITLCDEDTTTTSTTQNQQNQNKNKNKNKKKMNTPLNVLFQRYRTMKRMDIHSTKDKSLLSRYQWNTNDILGEGAFGSVYKAYEKRTTSSSDDSVPNNNNTTTNDEKNIVALKKISKTHTDDESFQREMRTLLHIKDMGGHPHVCSLHENFDDPDYYYLILDYIGGGEMFDHLIANGAYSEHDASRLVREVADALSFLHGIGIVHGDLKPENILLSTTRRGDSVVKLADFGCSQVLQMDDIQLYYYYDDEDNDNENENENNEDTNNEDDDELLTGTGTISNLQQRLLRRRKRKKTEISPKPCYETPTPAYCPPELMNHEQPMSPPMDMWGLGVILYIMLTGAHPFDLEGDTEDSVIEDRIMDSNHPLPIRNSKFTAHLSKSAIDLIEKLMTRDPTKRLTALEMLEHPWVRGETATENKIEGSDTKLSKFRVFKSKLQAKFFQDIVNWSDGINDESNTKQQKKSLIERSYQSLDTNQQGYLTTKNLAANLTSSSSGGGGGDDDETTTTTSSSSSSTSSSSAAASLARSPSSFVQWAASKAGVNTDESSGPTLSMSDFQHLLAENMRNRYFPAGKVIYKENEVGDHMYFINSGTVEVSTKDGSLAIRSQGDFFGEGALLHPNKTRSATVQCRTPVNAMEISREYFEKYLANSEEGLYLTLREKDKIRKKNRAKTILRLQDNLIRRKLQRGEAFFKVGDPGDSMFLLDRGRVDVEADCKQVFSVMPDNVFGEHSLMTGRNRNCSAVCVSDEGCDASELLGDDFRKLIKQSPNVAESLHELLLRREFKKAVVLRLRQQFPYQNPKEAFDAADRKNLGQLDVESVGRLMRDMNPNYTDEEIKEIIRALNLTNSGKVSFDEFKKVFIGDFRTASSM